VNKILLLASAKGIGCNQPPFSRRLLFLIIVLLAGLLLGGCTTTSRGERRLNLSPVFFYSDNPETDQSRLEILGPLFSRDQAGSTFLYTFAPLFYYLSADGSIEAEFLYPFGQYKSGDGNTRFNIIPLSSYRNEVLPQGASAWQFFPFYGGRTSQGEGYGGIFPFYGTYKERFGRDRGVFCLWPLYASSVAEDTYRYSILWPFFSYATGGEQAFTFWPFGGKIVVPGKSERYYALWPLINYQKLGLDTDTPRTVNTFIPFYAWETSKDYYRKSILYPFFTHYHQDKGNYDQWDTPWPFIVRGDGENFTLRNYFPFYYNRQEADKSRFAVLWWLYDHQIDNSGGTWEQTYRYLMFSSYTTEIDANGDWREKNRIWPLYFSTSRPGFRHAHAPELIIMQSPGFDRLFGPWVYLWSRDRQDTYRQGKAFWGIYRWQEDQDYRLWELSFLADRETTADSTKFRLLSGLVTWERQGNFRRLKLLYLPKGFSW
jgi:hypothetical protein